ncbi:hypothetical protein AND_009439 [Anopheles darlingi]|uniref:Uncharacterized protein n=1 Tax=Anopheles darlingi TaxID=43151 RepID=W5J3M0_ANODA|nr:hypothetical protein AND_009439 [Anopheles darlingi]
MAVSFAKLVPLLAGAALKATPAAASLTTAVGAAITAASAVVGVGKLAIVPILIASLAYYNYDLFDPENRPFNVPEVDREYDFIVVGAGSAGAVVASRLSEIGNWKVLLLEAGGHETEISDVPILSLYLHKSKLDWKYSVHYGSTPATASISKRKAIRARMATLVIGHAPKHLGGSQCQVHGTKKKINDCGSSKTAGRPAKNDSVDHVPAFVTEFIVTS